VAVHVRRRRSPRLALGAAALLLLVVGGECAALGVVAAHTHGRSGHFLAGRTEPIFVEDGR